MRAVAGGLETAIAELIKQVADPEAIKKAFVWTCNFWVMLFLVVLRGETERLVGVINSHYLFQLLYLGLVSRVSGKMGLRAAHVGSPTILPEATVALSQCYC